MYIHIYIYITCIYTYVEGMYVSERRLPKGTQTEAVVLADLAGGFFGGSKIHYLPWQPLGPLLKVKRLLGYM